METERMELSLGGCAANTAFDLSKLGVNTGISGCVGNDVLADFIVQTLNAAGVDTRGVVRSNEVATASTAVINVTDQDRRVISDAGANTAMTAALIPDGLLESVSVLYVGGFLMLDGLESEAMLQRLAQARKAGTRILLDVVQVGDADAMERLQRFLPFTDVFLPNNDEAALLTGFSNPWEQAEAFRSAGARTVVITEGDRGAHLLNDQLKLRAGAYATDFQGGTGAGDAFDAGFIAALLQGHDLPTCLRWGSALGASCVRSTSATGSVFNREEALQFMGSHAITVESC